MRMDARGLKTGLRAEVEFTCECWTREERQVYIVTGRDGRETLCAYCSDCARLAAMDWNGETAAIKLKAEADADFDAGWDAYYAGMLPYGNDDTRAGWASANAREEDL